MCESRTLGVYIFDLILEILILAFGFNTCVAATARNCEDDGESHEDVLPGLAVTEADE